MATLGSLIISLEANTAKFTDAMTKAEYAAKKASDTIVGAFKGIGAGLAAAFSISAMDAAFDRITSMESSLLKMATRLNTNVETLSSFGVMIRKTGMDSDAFYTTLTRMDKSLSAAALGAEQATGKYDENGEEIQKVAKAYDELGLKASELIKLPLTDRLLAIAEAMKANVEPGDQIRVAMEMGGKGAAGMVNIFREGPEAMQKWIDRATELGLITTDMAKRGAEAKSAAGDLSLAWSAFARELVDSVAPAITSTIELLTNLIVAARKSAQARADIAAGVHTGDFGEWGGEGGTNVGPTRGPRGATGTWLPEEIFKEPIREKPAAAKGGKGAGGAEDRIQSIIDTLQKDLSRLTEGSLAEIDAWATKMINDIEKVGKKGAETETALGMVAQVEAAKKKKATQDYENFVADQSGNAYAKIEADARAWSEKYKGFANAEENIATIKARKIWEEDVKNYENRLNLQKTTLDNLANEMPFLSQQLEIKAKILPLEIELQRVALERMIAENKISQSEADELRGLQALTAQAKRYALERQKWETQGIGGGMKMWAYGKQEEGQTSWAKQTQQGMKSLESMVSSTISKGIIGALKGEKADFEQIGWDLADAFISKAVELGVSQLFTMIAQAVLPMATTATLASTELVTAGLTVATEIETGAMVAGETLIAAATTAAAIMESASSFGMGFFHSGGVIRAHGGLNLASDEVPIIAQTGERILSRSQNQAFEAGIQMGGGGHTYNINYSPNYDRRPTGYEQRRDVRRLYKLAQEEGQRRN